MSAPTPRCSCTRPATKWSASASGTAACTTARASTFSALWDYRQKEGTIHGFKGAERADTEDLLVTDCEILVPAATESVITSANADQVKAKILVEGANGPTTAAADDILADKHVFVMPDILANAGGVTASYFEWVQDRQGYFWKESVVNEQLKDIMVSSFEDVVRYAETHHVNNRIAAYMLAIDRVAYTISSAGFTRRRDRSSR